ncbi:MAG: phosphoribosylanthranilate isomerase [Candidatus Humimicrobiaceae bacterium]
MTKIKICGIKSFKDLEYINEAQPDYIGFVFAKSKRHVDFNLAHHLKTELNQYIRAIGVFVNEDIDYIAKLCDGNVIDFIQIHGDEDEEYISALKKAVDKPIIKTVRVKERINTIYNDIDYILFDTYSKVEYGGTGESFNWDLVKEYKKPFFLAGGLNYGNVADAIHSAHPYCVDISSGVETNGIKDRKKIIDIVNLVRSIK